LYNFLNLKSRVADPDPHRSALFWEGGPGLGFALEEKAGCVWYPNPHLSQNSGVLKAQNGTRNGGMKA
jgi:hypothetical protein